MNERQYDMTGAWALNALDEDERARLEEYLAQDSAAADEAWSLQETAGELARGLAPETPRPAVKNSLMARISQTRQLSPNPAEDEDHAPTHRRESPTVGSAASEDEAPFGAAPSDPAPADPARTDPAHSDPAPPAPAPDASAPDATLVPMDRYRAARRHTRWLAVAATLLMVTTIAGVGLWSSERSAEEESRATIEAMASASTNAEAERELVSTLIAADDATHLTIPADTGGSLNLMYSRDQESMVVKASGLPELPEGSAYQLWMIGDSTESAGLISDPDQMVMLDSELPDATVLGLTVEPAGGSEQPTTEPIAQGELT